MQLRYFLLVFLLMIPLVSSEVIFPTNTQSDLQRPCFDNGEFCGSGFDCNITITRSGGVLVKDNFEMTRTDTYYNITLLAGDINVSGLYNAFMSCSNGSDSGGDTFTFSVNPAGLEQRTERTDTMSRSIYIFLILAVLCFIAGFKFDFVPFKMSFFIIGAVFVLVSINVTFVALQDEVVNPRIEGLFDTIVASSFYFYWLAAFLLFVLWFVTVMLNITKAGKARKQRRIDGFG